MTTTLTQRERELARHALGLDGRRKRSYRNRYVIGDGAPDHAVWLDMMDRGLARVVRGNPLTGRMDCFCLTYASALAALEPGELLGEEDFPR